MLIGLSVGLRAIEPDDLEPLRSWRNRPNLRRYFREHRELGSGDQQAWYERLVTSDHRFAMFAIVGLDGDHLLGAAGLCYIDWVRRSAESSLYLGVDDLYVDDVLAPDALRVLVTYGFNDLGLHRVWTEVYDYDTRKAQLYENAGFTLEGRQRESHFSAGRWHDSLFFGLLAAEHAARITSDESLR